MAVRKKGGASKGTRSSTKPKVTRPPGKSSSSSAKGKPPVKGIRDERESGTRGSKRFAAPAGDDRRRDDSKKKKRVYKGEGFGERRTLRAPGSSKSFDSNRPDDKRGGRTTSGEGQGEKRPFKTGSGYGKPAYGQRADGAPLKRAYRKPYGSKPPPGGAPSKDGLIRLNRFLSNAGIASRREADKLIELGLVMVNGKPATELGMKVDPSKDVVRYDDKSLKPERFQYVLLNKPKDYITTMDDPDGRKTVMSLVESACKERIYPVGRLDRNTTGLLLFTNDGDLAKRLTHPKHGYPKLYHVETTEKVNGAHLDQIREGVKLEDGMIKADEISFVNNDPFHVGIRIHSGKNRIVRRIFEHFGYTVKKLDRVMFASLTKKDLTRGRFRHLTENEVNYLKMIR